MWKKDERKCSSTSKSLKNPLFMCECGCDQCAWVNSLIQWWAACPGGNLKKAVFSGGRTFESSEECYGKRSKSRFKFRAKLEEISVLSIISWMLPRATENAEADRMWPAARGTSDLIKLRLFRLFWRSKRLYVTSRNTSYPFRFVSGIWVSS